MRRRDREGDRGGERPQEQRAEALVVQRRRPQRRPRCSYQPPRTVPFRISAIPAMACSGRTANGISVPVVPWKYARPMTRKAAIASECRAWLLRDGANSGDTYHA